MSVLEYFQGPIIQNYQARFRADKNQYWLSLIKHRSGLADLSVSAPCELWIQGIKICDLLCNTVYFQSPWPSRYSSLASVELYSDNPFAAHYTQKDLTCAENNQYINQCTYGPLGGCWKYDLDNIRILGSENMINTEQNVIAHMTNKLYGEN